MTIARRISPGDISLFKGIDHIKVTLQAANGNIGSTFEFKCPSVEQAVEANNIITNGFMHEDEYGRVCDFYPPHRIYRVTSYRAE